MSKYLLRARDIRTGAVIAEKEVLEAKDDPSTTQEGLDFLRKTRREVSGAAWTVDVFKLVITLTEN